MGMAASQGRLLMMTARLSNNEFEQQCVAYSKQRLADESQAANDQYLEALQETQYQVLTGYHGDVAQYQTVSYNNLTGFDNVATGKQYIVSDNKGRIVVTDAIAQAFKDCNGDYNKYLETVDPKTPLTQIAETEITEGMVHEAWDAYFASIGKGHEDGLYCTSTDGTQHILGLSYNAGKTYQTTTIKVDGNDTEVYIGKDGNYYQYTTTYKVSGDNSNHRAYIMYTPNVVTNNNGVLSVNSSDGVLAKNDRGNNVIDYASDSFNRKENFVEIPSPNDYVTYESPYYEFENGNKLSFIFDSETDHYMVRNYPMHAESYTDENGNTQYAVYFITTDGEQEDKKVYINESDVEVAENEKVHLEEIYAIPASEYKNSNMIFENVPGLSNYKTDSYRTDITMVDMYKDKYNVSSVDESSEEFRIFCNEKDREYQQTEDTAGQPLYVFYGIDKDTGKYYRLTSSGIKGGNRGYDYNRSINVEAYNYEKSGHLGYATPPYTYSYKIETDTGEKEVFFDTLLESNKENQSIIYYEGATEQQRQLYDYAMALTKKYAYTTLDSSGQQTYGYDTSMLMGDSEFIHSKLEYDADKVKYYTNIFQQMKAKGYTTYSEMVKDEYMAPMTYKTDTGKQTDALSSYEWLVRNIKNGKLSLSFYSTTQQKFIATTLDDDESIVNKENKSKMAIAEQIYQNHMDHLEAQDKQFDMKLTKLESEHTAIQTEYDSVAKVISKNVEKSFSIFNA